MYCVGAPATHYFPVSIPYHGCALNITVQSYLDQLDFGLIACSETVPDAQRIADFIVEDFAAMRKADAESERPGGGRDDRGRAARGCSARGAQADCARRGEGRTAGAEGRKEERAVGPDRRARRRDRGALAQARESARPPRRRRRRPSRTKAAAPQKRAASRPGAAKRAAAEGRAGPPEADARGRSRKTVLAPKTRQDRAAPIRAVDSWRTPKATSLRHRRCCFALEARGVVGIAASLRRRALPGDGAARRAAARDRSAGPRRGRSFDCRDPPLSEVSRLSGAWLEPRAQRPTGRGRSAGRRGPDPHAARGRRTCRSPSSAGAAAASSPARRPALRPKPSAW